MSWGEPRSYRSDDRDLEQCDYRLDVSMGENGDWYLCIVRSDKKSSWEHVRITTSGSKRPGVANAIADLYRALGEPTRDHVWVYDGGLRAGRRGPAGFGAEPRTSLPAGEAGASGAAGAPERFLPDVCVAAGKTCSSSKVCR